MNIAMISSGDEVLDGDIVDTNAAWCSQLMREHGLPIRWRFTVGDDLADLQTLFNQAAELADVIIVNGGLGPTTDDLSAQAMAQTMGVELAINTDWLTRMQQRYANNQRSMPESNRKQALLPVGAELIDNPVGTACGFRCRYRNSDFYFTPGVPSEFKVMVQQQILPRLHSSAPVLPWHRFYTFGLSESGISDRIKQLALPDTVRLGFRSAMPGIEIKLQGPSPEIELAGQYIRDTFGDFIFSTRSAAFTDEIQQQLLERGQTLVCAESCTGGMIASRLVAEPGSSGYLLGGWVTYSNQMKTQQLGVASHLLEQHGAVSIPVAEAMASGACRASGCDYALATSGIAGPDGGTEQKPVGTVAFALATPDGVYSQQLLITDRGRRYVREMACYVALDMLRRDLAKLPIFADYEHMRRIA